MEKEINIAEILNGCPKGKKLYSQVFGGVVFEKIEEGLPFPIKVIDHNLGINRALYFDEYGRGNIGNNIPSKECLLFPSRDQRDWSVFAAKESVTYFIDDCGKVWFRKGFKTEEDKIRSEIGNEFATREKAEYAAKKYKELLLSLRKEAGNE